jgi:putative ABC transport system substrate-binding protein
VNDIGRNAQQRRAFAAENELVAADYGGVTTEVSRRAFYQPFEKATGIKVIEATTTGFAQLKAMILAGNVQWDIVSTEEQNMYVGGATGMLAASLAHPGGNITGFSILSTELDSKRQELLIELVPGARRMAALFDPASKSAAELQEMVNAARARGVEISTHRVAKAEEIVPAIDAAQVAGAAALNVLATVLLHANRQLILERTTALRMPAIYQFPESAEQGGFAAYGPRLEQIYRQVAVQIARLLRGERPQDLPVQQATIFELVINLKTANAIGLAVPESFLIRADKVIE